MAKLQVIKELVSRGRSEGMDKVAADLNKVATAQEGVARAGEVASKATDTAARRQISATAAYDRLLKSVDEGYRAQQLYARGQSVLDRAMEQGKISAEEYARTLDLLNAKYLQPKSPAPAVNDNDAGLAYQRLMLSIDAAARAQTQFAEGQAVLSRALEAGKIDAQEYARALDLLKDRYAITQAADIVPQSSVQGVKMASHEMANLSAQVQDIGVSLAGGMNPFTVMLQQGSQISQIMGDRGVKSILSGVGQALLSLVNPTTAVLAGFTAIYVGASYAYEAIKGDSKSVEDGLKEQERLLKIVEKAYDDVAGAASKWNSASRAATVVETTKALADMKKQMDDLSKGFLTGGWTGGGIGTQTRGGFKVSDEFKAFSVPLNEFRASAKAADDITRLYDAIGRIGEANPALQEAAAKLLEMARGGGDADKSMKAAAEGVAQLEAQLRVLSGTATQADLDLLKLANSAKDMEAAAKIIEDLRREGGRIGDDRAQAVGRVTDRLPKGASQDQVAEATRLANENYEKEKDARDAEKRANEAEREAKRTQRELTRDAKRVWDETRTSAESYADELQKLNELLEKGAISQDTYARAAAKASEDMRDRSSRERYEAALKSGDGYSAGLMEYSRSVGTLAEQTADATNSLLGGMEDAFADFVTTGKTSFKDFANSIISDMARIAARQAIMGLFGSSATGVGSFFSGMFGGGGTVGATTGASIGLHGGGVGAAEAAFVRMDDPSLYIGAPRYHTGRDPFGLMAGERRAIIKDDEGVFTAGQMKAMGAQMNSASPNVTVNVQTLPGTTADVQPRQNADGSISMEVIMRQVKGAIASDLEERGPLARKLEGGYGLKRALR